MTYVDGFVIPVPTDARDRYLKHARDCVPIFKKYGALRLVEGWGVDVPDGEQTSHPLALKLKTNETVMYSWIEWPSKEARDTGMEALVKDPFFEQDHDIPFDAKRMILGGFEVVLDE